jgi:hypothetical protein
VPHCRLASAVTTQHIGATGELLVQYRLLKVGIDSARLTTDAVLCVSHKMMEHQPNKTRMFSHMKLI